MVTAKSTTQDVIDWLVREREVQLLHVFPNVWNLIDDQDFVVSVVTPAIGNGAFNIVLTEKILPSIQPDAPIRVAAGFYVGSHQLDLTNVRLWDARPDITHLLPITDLIAACQSLLRFPEMGSAFEQMARESINANTRQILIALQNQQAVMLIKGVESVTGKGVGLTPAGDDWLLGCIVALHLKSRTQMIDCIVDAAVPLTTPLSAAWLKAAREFKLDEEWHRLLSAGSPAQCYDAAYAILNRGATSGAYALAGFIDTLMLFR